MKKRRLKINAEAANLRTIGAQGTPGQILCDVENFTSFLSVVSRYDGQWGNVRVRNHTIYVRVPHTGEPLEANIRCSCVPDSAYVHRIALVLLAI